MELSHGCHGFQDDDASAGELTLGLIELEFQIHLLLRKPGYAVVQIIQVELGCPTEFSLGRKALKNSASRQKGFEEWLT